MPLLYEWSCRVPVVWPRVAERGTPSPAAFAERLWQGVFAQYVVHTDSEQRPTGVAAVYGVDLLAGTAWIDLTTGGSASEHELSCAAFLIVDFAFATCEVRWVYASTIEPMPCALQRLAVGIEVGRFPQDSLVDGEYCDRVVRGLERPDWMAMRGQIEATLLGRGVLLNEGVPGASGT